MSRGRREKSYEPHILSRYVYPRKKTGFQTGTLKIGELSKKTDIPIVTLRFYENHKLIKPKKSPDKRTNHRRYPQSVLAEIEFIKLCRSAGFALPEIRSLMKLFRGFKPPAKLLMGAVYRTLDSIRQKVQSLEEVQRILILRMRDPQSDIAKLIEEDPEILRLRGFKKPSR